MKQARIMWIEYKVDGLVGPAHIGRVTFSKSGKSIYYRGSCYTRIPGGGFKSNYYDEDTGDKYWISGCHKDGCDALYNTDVKIDEDVREEYWCKVRQLPEQKHVSAFRARGKYR